MSWLGVVAPPCNPRQVFPVTLLHLDNLLDLPLTSLRPPPSPLSLSLLSLPLLTPTCRIWSQIHLPAEGLMYSCLSMYVYFCCIGVCCFCCGVFLWRFAMMDVWEREREKRSDREGTLERGTGNSRGTCGKENT